MAGRKKVVARQDKTVEPRQEKKVAQRWAVIKEYPDRVVFGHKMFVDNEGNLDLSTVWKAKQTYPDKAIEIRDPANKRSWMARTDIWDKTGAQKPDIPGRLEKSKRWGLKTHPFDYPEHDPKAPSWVQEHARDVAADIAKRKEKARQIQHAKVTEKVVTPPTAVAEQKADKATKSKKGRSRKTLEDGLLDLRKKVYTSPAGRAYSNLVKAIRSFDKRVGRTGKKNVTALNAHRERLMTGYKGLRKDLYPEHRADFREWMKKRGLDSKSWHREMGRRVKEVRPRAYRSGEKFVKGKELRPYQYRASSGLVYNVSRARIQRHNDLVAKRKFKAELANLRKSMKQIGRQRAAIRKRERRAGYAKNRRAKIQSFFKQFYMTNIKGMKGFGSAPAKVLMKQNGMTERARGKTGAMKALTREQLYPKMGFSSKAPRSAPVDMRAVSGRLGLTDVHPDAGDLRWGGRRASMFATKTTVDYMGNAVDGRGVMLMIDVQDVLDRLTRKFPGAIHKAALAAGDVVGRKMLDIVEPYVPKDTGLMYSTAQTNIGQSASGMLSFEGGGLDDSQMYGVSISYNTPYAEIVYFDEDLRHGKEYNAKYGAGLRGEKETARWIEEAFKQERTSMASLLNDYAVAITSALESAGAGAMRVKTRR